MLKVFYNLLAGLGVNIAGCQCNPCQCGPNCACK
jgi:hypothetical protein